MQGLLGRFTCIIQRFIPSADRPCRFPRTGMLESLLFQFTGFLNLFTPGPYKDMAGMCLQFSLSLMGPT